MSRSDAGAAADLSPDPATDPSTDPTGSAAPRWSSGAATGIGSMPGTDPRAAARTVFDELPDLPHLVELPGRGAGADMIGRTMALLPGFAASTVPTGWRLSDRPGPDTRRARAWLEEDLDVLEEVADGYAGPLKVAVTGPFTLAAGVELTSGERALRDHGAARDLAASLADAIGTHVAEVRRRVPGAQVLLQVDEPSLPAVLRAQVPTASGFATLRAVDPARAEAVLGGVLKAARDAGAFALVHSCAGDVPIPLLRAAGARAVSVDLGTLRADPATDDALGVCVESGLQLFLGVVPTDGSGPSDPAGTVGPVQQWWRRIGFEPERLASSVVLTPACGLAGLSPAAARTLLARTRAAARRLSEDPEGRGEQ